MIQILKGDLAALDFDIIVNEANTELLPGAGISQIIFQRAETGLLEELQKHAPRQPGETVLTDSYALPAEKILHVVTPVHMAGFANEEEDLAACWWNSLSAAYSWMRENRKDHLTMGFPSLGTGVFGFEDEDAASIAARTVSQMRRSWPDVKMIDIFIVCQTPSEYSAFKKAFSR